MKQVSKQFKKFFELVGGQTEEEKLDRLAVDFARFQLLASQQAADRFEAQFGMSFEEFSDWLKRQPEEIQYRHDLERAFMEWEGHEASRRYWLFLTYSTPVCHTEVCIENRPLGKY